MSRKEHGVTYLGVLLLIVLSTGALGALGSVWSTIQRREKERELLVVGEQFRRAIKSYHDMSPGGVKRYPPSFEELLKDPRHSSLQRHLRRVFLDPVTGKAEWGIVQSPSGGIMGVYSLSDRPPLKTGNFPLRFADFDGKTRYSNWKFVYAPASPSPAATPQPLGAR